MPLSSQLKVAVVNVIPEEDKLVTTTQGLKVVKVSVEVHEEVDEPEHIV